MTALSFLRFLAEDAPVQEFDRLSEGACQANATSATVNELDEARELALQVRHMLDTSRRREAELAALYETANDLASHTELRSVLEAIVARARRLLGSDLSYMTLVDEENGDTYTTVTDGGASALFREIRVQTGKGIGGLVAQTGIPHSTASYFDDKRIQHTSAMDAAVTEEGLVAILGVPLMVGHKVIGVLFAGYRTERPFPPSDVALLSSFAAHAAVALDKARLRSDLQVTSDLLRERNVQIERAARAHDRLAALVLQGGDLTDVAHEVRDLLGGEVAVVDVDETIIASTTLETTYADAVRQAGDDIRSVGTHAVDGVCATSVVAGSDLLGYLVVIRTDPVNEVDQRILERAAMVTGLILLFRRSLADTENRVRGELLEDILLGHAEHGTIERAVHVGVDLTVAYMVMVAELRGERNRLAHAAGDLTSAHHGLSTVFDGRLVIAFPSQNARQSAELVSNDLGRTWGQRPTVGVAGPVTGVGGIRAAHTEAGSCLEALLGLGRPGHWAQTADLGFVGLLLSRDRDIDGFIRSVLGPLLDYDAERRTELELTLQTFYDTGGNINQTAATLHLHPKTVSQRLDRINRLLGDRSDDTGSRLQIQIALHLREVRSHLDRQAR